MIFNFIFQQIDPSDPDKYSTILPLSIVLGFSAVKEIYEDIVSSRAFNINDLIFCRDDGTWITKLTMQKLKSSRLVN